MSYQLKVLIWLFLHTFHRRDTFSSRFITTVPAGKLYFQNGHHWRGMTFPFRYFGKFYIFKSKKITTICLNTGVIIFITMIHLLLFSHRTTQSSKHDSIWLLMPICRGRQPGALALQQGGWGPERRQLAQGFDVQQIPGSSTFYRSRSHCLSKPQFLIPRDDKNVSL